MDSTLSGRYVLGFILCCLIPSTISINLEGLFQQVDADSSDEISRIPVYNSWMGPFALGPFALSNPRTSHYQTNHRFTSKRGWDVIEKIWQPQFPKRAWEFVDRVWKIPKLRKKYLRYLHPNKRSKEFIVNVPVQHQTYTNTLASSYDTQTDGNTDNMATDDGGLNLLVKELYCRCCLQHRTGDCCEKCKVFMLQNK